MVKTSDGGFALDGETESYGAGDCDVLFVKTNEQGVQEIMDHSTIILDYTSLQKEIISATFTKTVVFS